jgi:molybdopterin/thiamine biosynthesis adenylyltransferase
MGAQFTDEEIERYARHLVLREVGGPGQQKLKAATVLIVGAGGLGAPAALYLAAAGVGSIRIVDPDVGDHSNRQRQNINKSTPGFVDGLLPDGAEFEWSLFHKAAA